MKVPALTALELKEELNGPNPPRLLDVRDPEELEITRFPVVLNIPLTELTSRMSELDPSADWVVVCRAGSRSAHATAYLQAHGFQKVRNLTDGMNGWSRTVDPSMPLY